MARVRAEAERLGHETEELDARTAELSRLGPESVCPTCERQLGEHHHHLMNKFQDERKQRADRLLDLEGELAKMGEELERMKRRKAALDERKRKLQEVAAQESGLMTRIEGCEQRSRELAAQLAAALEEMEALSEVSFDPEAHRRLRDRIALLRPRAEKAKTLRGESSRMPEMIARLAERKAAVELAEAELVRARTDLAGIGYDPAELKRAREGYDTAFHAREAAYAEVSRIATALELASGRLDDRKAAREEMREAEASMAQLAAKVERLATLEKVMIDFRQNIMDRIVPTLAEVSSRFFTEMTDARYGGIELDEDYEMQIYDGGERYPLSRFSGGEGDLANLSLRLAISRVLADRSGNDINFLILDEIFGSQTRPASATSWPPSTAWRGSSTRSSSSPTSMTPRTL